MKRLMFVKNLGLFPLNQRKTAGGKTVQSGDAEVTVMMPGMGQFWRDARFTHRGETYGLLTGRL